MVRTLGFHPSNGSSNLLAATICVNMDLQVKLPLAEPQTCLHSNPICGLVTNAIKRRQSKLAIYTTDKMYSSRLVYNTPKIATVGVELKRCAQ